MNLRTVDAVRTRRRMSNRSTTRASRRGRRRTGEIDGTAAKGLSPAARQGLVHLGPELPAISRTIREHVPRVGVVRSLPEAVSDVAGLDAALDPFFLATLHPPTRASASTTRRFSFPGCGVREPSRVSVPVALHRAGSSSTAPRVVSVSNAGASPPFRPPPPSSSRLLAASGARIDGGGAKGRVSSILLRCSLSSNDDTAPVT